MSDVTARVISQRGTCVAHHAVGDEFIIGEKTPPGMCVWAFYTLFPFAEVLQFGGSFPWEKDKTRTTVACPDPGNPTEYGIQNIQYRGGSRAAQTFQF